MRTTRSQAKKKGAGSSSSEVQESSIPNHKNVRSSAKLVGSPVVDVEKNSLQSQEECKLGDKVHNIYDAIKCNAYKAEENSSSIAKEIGNASISSHCDANEMDWEEGAFSTSNNAEAYAHDIGRTVTVEFAESPSIKERKSLRRASAEEKESAELGHKVHLLCLLARGRIVDKACNDPLIQASILSLLPSNFQKVSDVPRLTAAKLEPIANWIRQNFRVTTESTDRGSFESKLASALQNQEGSLEEVGALSVALFRALNLTTRYVSILDVASLKPDVNGSKAPKQEVLRLDTKGVKLSKNVVSPAQLISPSSVHPQSGTECAQVYSKRKNREGKNAESCKKNLEQSLCSSNLKGENASTCSSKVITDPSSSKGEGSKRKGDLEFELQLEMAISSTAAEVRETIPDSHGATQNPSSASPFKRIKQTIAKPSSPISSSAVWSRIGPPLCWAEVYCNGESLSGRWVHVDAANGIIDGEDKVEAAVSVHRKSLNYVVAFAGNGAKDVTRRYCRQWYKISSRRTNSEWWENVLAPLKELELQATGLVLQSQISREKPSAELAGSTSSECRIELDNVNSHNVNPVTNTTRECKIQPNQSETRTSDISYRGSLEDMELAIRSLTEPLPTNQQAYRNHHLYALEKWLNKNQILHPKGPVLGFCSGHPVYPRSCVQILHARQRWLRDGLQVKSNEIPAKVVKRSNKTKNGQRSELDDFSEDTAEPKVELYGRWQLEPLQLPHAENGIVPKNDHGNVEVWSEKCLPPGTVHLRLPRLVPVVRRLQIDFAPAMVGFEYRNGRTFPLFDGIVICAEFKDALIEAYGEVEEQRQSEERKQDEVGALSRWYQLFSSIVTRQRLHSSYASTSSMQAPPLCPTKGQDGVNSPDCGIRQADTTVVAGEYHPRATHPDLALPSDDHQHVFPLESQSYDEELNVRTKRCPCGFSIQIEEL